MLQFHYGRCLNIQQNIDDFHFCRSRVIELDYDGKYDFYPMSYDNLSIVSQNILNFYQQLTGEERRIPFIFDNFHFCRSRVIGLDYDRKYDFYPMSYDNLSSVSQNVLKFYQQLTSEERRIPFIFEDFHFCRSRVIGLDMTDNRIFTLCRMIT
jgi:hypothetical protein